FQAEDGIRDFHVTGDQTCALPISSSTFVDRVALHESMNFDEGEMMAHPVVIVGAGPVGLAAAAELVERDVEVLVFERGASVGAHVTEWGHVRLFSPWSELVAPAARRLLEAGGWIGPAGAGYPTGSEWVRDYLAPLAQALGERVHTGAE